MSKPSQSPQPSQPQPTAFASERERGSTLVLISLIVFVFLTASLLFASTQATHARRLRAEFGKLQAIYAAESGIYAAFDTRQSVPTTTMWTATGTLVQFQAVRQPDGWVASTGSVKLGDSDLYTAKARAFISGNQIVMWEFQ